VVLVRSGHAEVSLTACRRAPAAHDRASTDQMCWRDDI
jgi:hypothetical protein